MSDMDCIAAPFMRADALLSCHTHATTILITPATIPGNGAVLEMQGIPTELILYAVHNWNPCQKYTTKRSVGNNTNPFLKGIEVWLIMKSMTTSGRLQNYRRQLTDIAEMCKVKERTVQARIAWLAKEGLIRIEGKALLLLDFKVLRKYHINIYERTQTIYYDTQGEATLGEILIAIAMGKMKERWLAMYRKKLTQNPNTLAEVRNHLLAHGADASQLDDLEYFRERHMALLLKTYQMEESGQSSFRFLHEVIEANPDLNARQDTLATKLGYAAAMSFCHLKFKLIKKGLLRVRKDHIRSEYRARKDEKIFHHRWLEKTKQTIWFRPDQIEVLYAVFFAAPAARKTAF